jgi:MFS family permease
MRTQNLYLFSPLNAHYGWFVVSLLWASHAIYFLFKNRKSALMMIGGMGAFIILVLSLISSSSPSWAVYLLSIFFGMTGMGWNAIWLTLIGEMSSKESIGLGIGFSFFIANLGVVIGPPIFGLLVDLFNSFAEAWLFLAF